jgi:putative redox protein
MGSLIPDLNPAVDGRYFLAEVKVKWLEEKRFVGIDSTDHGIVISSVSDEGRIGVKPSDLLLLSLGSCSAYDVIGILRKKRQQVTGLEVRVTASQLPDPPWQFTEFHIHYQVRGQEISEKAVADAIKLSDTKYCSVAATLKTGVPITHDFEIVQES